MSSDEKWTAEVRSALMTLDGMARTSYQQQALRTIKDALMVGSILDADGDGGRVHSEKFAKTKAHMLIFKSQGYDCEKLSDEQEKQA